MISVQAIAPSTDHCVITHIYEFFAVISTLVIPADRFPVDR